MRPALLPFWRRRAAVWGHPPRRAGAALLDQAVYKGTPSPLVTRLTRSRHLLSRRRPAPGALAVATAVATAVGIALAMAVAPARAQEFSLPFAVGEALNYQVRIARLGDVGTGRMWIEGPVVEQGVPVWRLRSEINAGRGPIRATDRTSSWLDPRRMAIMRFKKEEHHVLSKSEEDVSIDRATHRWQDEDGTNGALGSEQPLDELSFLYFLRTIPIDRDTVLRFDRHFDPARNPTMVHVKGEETLTTGSFARA
jgi:hypothetical protein